MSSDNRLLCPVCDYYSCRCQEYEEEFNDETKCSRCHQTLPENYIFVGYNDSDNKTKFCPFGCLSEWIETDRHN